MHSLVTNAQIVNALRITIQQLEQESSAPPEDPALIALKRMLLQRLAEKTSEEQTDTLVEIE